MHEDISIYIASEFSKTLGARYIYESDWSGELFFNNLLRPKFILAKESDSRLNIYLDDGVLGYPSSFVSGSFGKLSLEFSSGVVLKHLKLITDNQLRKIKIENEIINPQRK